MKNNKTLDIEGIRSQIPALRRCIFLNTGGAAPLPQSVIDALIDAYMWVGENGYITPDVFNKVPELVSNVRYELAELVGAETAEICLTKNTTEGFYKIFQGINFSPEDEIITSNQENPAVYLPLANLARLKRLKIKILTLTDNSDLIINKLDELVTPKTKLVLLSHVTHSTGLVLPFKELCAYGKEKNIPILWDGAQAAGQIPINLSDTECDFYSGCSYKWLMGPIGAGYLYIRRSWLEKLDTSEIGYGSQASFDLSTLNFQLKNDASRYEYGARDWAIYMGFLAGIRFVREWGVDLIRNRILSLNEYMRDLVNCYPNLVYVSSTTPEFSSSLTTIAILRSNPQKIVSDLWNKYRILIQWRNLPPTANQNIGLRFSLGFFNLEKEIEQTMEAIQKIVRMEN